MLFESAYDSASQRFAREGSGQLIYLLRRCKSVINNYEERSFLTPVEQYICFYGSDELVLRMLSTCQEKKEDEKDKCYFFVRYYLLLANRLHLEKTVGGDNVRVPKGLFRNYRGTSPANILGTLQGSVKVDGSARNYDLLPLYLALDCKSVKYDEEMSDLVYHSYRWAVNCGFSASYNPHLKELPGPDGSLREDENVLECLADARSIGANHVLEISGCKDLTKIKLYNTKIFAHRCPKCAYDGYRDFLVPDWRILNKFRQYPIRSAAEMASFHKRVEKDFIEHMSTRSLAYRGYGTLPSDCIKMAELEFVQFFKQYQVTITDGVLKDLLRHCRNVRFMKLLIQDPDIPKELTHKSIPVILRLSASLLKLFHPILVKLVKDLYEKLGESTDNPCIIFDFSEGGTLRIPFPHEDPTKVKIDLPQRTMARGRVYGEQSPRGTDGLDIDDWDDEDESVPNIMIGGQIHSKNKSDEEADAWDEESDISEPEDDGEVTDSDSDEGAPEKKEVKSFTMERYPTGVPQCRNLIRLWAKNKDNFFRFVVNISGSVKKDTPRGHLVEEMKELGFPDWSYTSWYGGTALFIINRVRRCVIETTRVDLGEDLASLFKILTEENWEMKDVEVKLVDSVPDEFGDYVHKKINI